MNLRRIHEQAKKKKTYIQEMEETAKRMRCRRPETAARMALAETLAPLCATLATHPLSY